MAMTIKWDMVSGHQLDQDASSGRIIRVGLATAGPAGGAGGIPVGSVSSATMLTQLAQNLSVPGYGLAYPAAGYGDFRLMRRSFRALTAVQYLIICEYVNIYASSVVDASSLQMMTTELHPSGSPLYVKYTDPGPPSVDLEKPLQMTVPLPIRNFTFTTTQDYIASSTLLDVIGCVNEFVWQGLPKGYWLVTGLTGETHDAGITFTYSVTFSTKQREDWSQWGFLRNPTGQSEHVPPSVVLTLRKLGYEYGVNNNYKGIVKVGMHPTADFFGIFGF